MQRFPSLVIDSLIFYNDGDPSPLLDGNVTAANLTCVNPLSGLVEAVDEMAVWLRRLSLKDTPWQLVRTVADIDEARADGKFGLIFGWQNILPIENRLDRLALFHALGLRVIQLSFNEASLAAHGCLEDGRFGLTRFGRDVVAEANRLGIAIDLSHCAEQVAIEASEITSRPLLITHANASAVFNVPRNKSDEVIRAVAGTGGVIGLTIHGFMNWDGDPQNPPSLEGLIRNIRHVRDLVGIEHIGVGTDYAAVSRPGAADFFLTGVSAKYEQNAGAYLRAFGNTLECRYPADVPTPRDYPRIFDALRKAGFAEEDIEKIAGANFYRAFSEIWPGDAAIPPPVSTSPPPRPAA